MTNHNKSSEQQTNALQALAESEERFRNLVEASPDAIFVHQEERIAFANASTLILLLAREPEQLLGKSIAEIVHPDFLPAVRQRIQRCLVTGVAACPMEQPLTRLDGSLVEIEAVAIPCMWNGAPAVEVVARDITERKRAERTALEWQKRLELAEKAALRIGLWEWYIREDKLIWSDETCRQFGYTRKNLTGTGDDFRSRLHPEDRPGIEAAVQAVLDGGSTYEVQFRVIRPDGSTCWLDARGTLVRDEPTRMIGISIDITKLKQAQESLAESEEKYRLLLNSTAEGIYGLDMNGRCTFCNPAAAHWFGYRDPEDLLEKNVHREHHHTRPDGTPYPECECKIFQAFREGKGTHVDDELFFRVDGTSFPCDYWSYPVRRGHELVGAVVTLLDITDRRLAEDRLRWSEANYRSIVETAPYGIYHSTLDGRFLMANPALVAMLGYNSESELLSLRMTCDLYLVPEERARFITHVLETGHAEQVEIEWKHKDGRTITVRNTAIPVRNNSGEVEAFLGFAENLTERKTLEKQFSQAQKMEAVGQLASGVAHDFNNVLMIVSSYAELIQLGANNGRIKHYADLIHQAALNAASVNQQLLAFSRMQVVAPEVLDLNRMVKSLGEILPKILGKEIEFQPAFDATLERVKVDRGQMEQIIMNLAVNARDAMPQGGCLVIETKNVDVDAVYAEGHFPMVPGAYVMLSVADTGIGMDAETKLHIFEPFFTTKERGKGTGLGLAAVLGIVKQSGGFVWVNSVPGAGTVFQVYLPPVRSSARLPELDVCGSL
jgi:two-component system cell cycle sensor histidine kinase/response regulator CckA